MTALGQHAVFIVGAYVAAAIIVLALLAWVIADYYTQRAILKRLEERGVTRRSAGRRESR